MIETFDDDGRRRPPGRDWHLAAFIGALVVVPALASWGIAWILDANLSPARIATGVAALAAMTAMFAVHEWCWRVERQERIAYEDELRAELERERRATQVLSRIVDDATGINDDPRSAA
jgi:hypothetical protein